MRSGWSDRPDNNKVAEHPKKLRGGAQCDRCGESQGDQLPSRQHKSVPPAKRDILANHQLYVQMYVGPACHVSIHHQAYTPLCVLLRNIRARLEPESKCKHKYVRCKCGGTDTACWTQNRCSDDYHDGLQDSWEAYAFRPPLPDLSAEYLTSSIYMNMCHAENRAGAALYHAGVTAPYRKHKSSPWDPIVCSINAQAT